MGDLNRFVLEKNGDWFEYLGFLQGYRTAFNEKQPNTYDILPDNQIMFHLNWLEKWCGLFPDYPFADAVIALAQSQYASRVQKDSRFSR